MANPVRMRRRAARRQARKYRKMSQEQRLQRVEAAKARRAQNQKSTSGVSYKVSTPVDKVAKVKAVKADIQKKKSVSKQNEITIANRKAAAAAKPGETYIRTMKDGTKKKVRAVKKAKNGGKITNPPKKKQTLSEKRLREEVDNVDFKMRGLGNPKDAESAKMIARSDNTNVPTPRVIKSKDQLDKERKEKAKNKRLLERDKKQDQVRKKYQESKKNNKKTVKVVKKAPGGASMKKMPTYKKGGALKSVPSDAKGLSKLPTGVRNKMGYAQDGGKLGGKPKRFTRAGVTYVWDEESQNYLGDMAGNVPKGGMSSDFGTAFKAAKRYGKDEFTWQGKKYSTKMKEEKVKTVKKKK